MEIFIAPKNPKLYIITGCPGAGKTTLARELSKWLYCPAICRDEIKEGYVNTFNSSHEALGEKVNAMLYELFFKIVDKYIESQISIVAEAAFQHKLWYPKLLQLKDKTEMHIIICNVDASVARERFIARGLSNPNRLRYHGDKSVYPIGNYEPPQLDIDTINIDTTNGYSPAIAEIVKHLQA